MESDRIKPVIAIGKEANIHVSFGYSVDEFTGTLHTLADGRIDGRIDGVSMSTGRIGLDGVVGAFSNLEKPDEHVKIMITFD